MSGPRKVYRVYAFDRIQKILSADLVKAVSDEDAVAKAEAAGFGTRCEIWHGKRMVAELDGERRTA